MTATVVTPLTPARALREPRRVDVRAIFGGFLLLVATGGAIAFWNVTSDTRPVLVAARDLPAGARLTAGDLTVARVRVDDALYGAAIPASERDRYADTQLNEPIHAHQLLTRAQLSARSALGPDQLALTLPVSADAISGRVVPGASVQILATTNKGKPESQTTVVLPRAQVLEVGYDERVGVVNASGAGAAEAVATSDGAARPRGRVTSVTILVPQEVAPDIARARWNADIDVAVLPPEG